MPIVHSHKDLIYLPRDRLPRYNEYAARGFDH